MILLASGSSDFRKVSLVGAGATILSTEEVFSASVELVIPSVAETSGSSDFREVSLVGAGATILSTEEVFSASVESVIPSVSETFAGSLLVSSA